jgi:hypothetical protein
LAAIVALVPVSGPAVPVTTLGGRLVVEAGGVKVTLSSGRELLTEYSLE